MLWCRACGQPQAAQAGQCSSCGADLTIEMPQPTPVGLAFAVRNRLGVGKRLGLCLNVSGDSLLMHFRRETKGHSTGIAPSSRPHPAPAVGGYAAPVRGNLPDSTMSWDREALRRLVVDHCRDIRVRRQVVDEALGLGWPQIVDWISLSASEKAWRSAHHAAVTRMRPRWLKRCVRLPDSGYPTRGELLLPFLGAIRQRPEVWRPVLERMVAAQIPHASEIAMATMSNWNDAMASAVRLLPTER